MGNSTGSATMFGVGNKFRAEYPQYIDMCEITHKSSLDPDFLRPGELIKHMVNCNWRLGLSSEQWDGYVERTQVLQITPKDLLAEHQIESEDVIMLTVDAEGKDVEIINLFF